MRLRFFCGQSPSYLSRALRQAKKPNSFDHAKTCEKWRAGNYFGKSVAMLLKYYLTIKNWDDKILHMQATVASKKQVSRKLREK